VTSIGDCAFKYCNSLTDIIYQGTMEEWNKIGKASDWSDKIYTIHCTDGDITKEGSFDGSSNVAERLEG
jgi:hypothetical protein